MRKWLLGLAAAGLLASPAAQAQDEAVFRPAGTWTADYGDDYCRLIRTFTDGTREVSLALELHEAGGSLAPPHDRLWGDETRHSTLIFGLEVPKAVLDERIRERTKAMFERGVEAEVERAGRTPISKTAGQIIGLREIAALPRTEAVAAIELATRQYAAYQRKWMRRIPSIHAVSADRAPSDTAAEIIALVRAH